MRRRRSSTRRSTSARAWRPTCCRSRAQIQIACDAAKFCVARLAGIEAPKFEDNETTLAELRAAHPRRRSTTCKSVPADADRRQRGRARSRCRARDRSRCTMKGEAYLKHFALPNFYFHVTTAYALLRHNGVELGKSDFLGALPHGRR